MINEEEFDREEVPGQEDENINDVNPLSLEEQEQQNSRNLVNRIEEENAGSDDYGDDNDRIDEESQGGEDLNSFTDRELPSLDNDAVGSDEPVTKNLLGDNPPGSEQKAFDAGTGGDMSADQAKYIDENIVENFRENVDKTASQVELDKRLKGDGQ